MICPQRQKCRGVESNGVASDNLESDYRQVYALSGFFQGDCKHANGGTDPGRSVNSKTALPPSRPGLAMSMLGLVSRAKSTPGSQASAGISHYLNFSGTLVSCSSRLQRFGLRLGIDHFAPDSSQKPRYCLTESGDASSYPCCTQQHGHISNVGVCPSLPQGRSRS
jgi:hypothetical protein